MLTCKLESIEAACRLIAGQPKLDQKPAFEAIPDLEQDLHATGLDKAISLERLRALSLRISSSRNELGK